MAITSRAEPVLDRLAAHPWPWLLLVTVAATIAQLLARPTWLGSWYFTRLGVHTLFSPGGLHLYAVHPELQMGPLTFVVCAPIVLLSKGVVAKSAGMVLMLAVGLFAARQSQVLLADDDGAGRLRWFLAAAGLLIGWTELAVRFGHPDDAFALASAAVALRLMRSGRVELAALAVGLSVDFKPWALPFAGMLLAADRRRWLPAAAVLAGTIVLAWAPFFLADPHSVNALRFRIAVSPASTLRLLGVRDRTTPAWCRPAQFVGGAVLAALAVRRGRLLAVVLAVVAFRLLLDPGVRSYYDAGLLVGALTFDIAAALPLATPVVLLLVLLPSYLLVHVPLATAALRTLALVLLIGGALLARQRIGGPGEARRPPARSGRALTSGSFV